MQQPWLCVHVCCFNSIVRSFPTCSCSMAERDRHFSQALAPFKAFPNCSLVGCKTVFLSLAGLPGQSPYVILQTFQSILCKNRIPFLRIWTATCLGSWPTFSEPELFYALLIRARLRAHGSNTSLVLTFQSGKECVCAWEPFVSTLLHVSGDMALLCFGYANRRST